MPLRPSAHDWTGLALLLRAHEVVLAAQETRLDSAGDVGLLETWKWAKTGRNGPPKAVAQRHRPRRPAPGQVPKPPLFSEIGCIRAFCR